MRDGLQLGAAAPTLFFHGGGSGRSPRPERKKNARHKTRSATHCSRAAGCLTDVLSGSAVCPKPRGSTQDSESPPLAWRRSLWTPATLLKRARTHAPNVAACAQDGLLYCCKIKIKKINGCWTKNILDNKNLGSEESMVKIVAGAKMVDVLHVLIRMETCIVGV